MAKPSTTKKNKPISKSAVLQAVAGRGRRGGLAQAREAGRRELVDVGHKELKKNGIFVLHGFAKFVVVKKPARPAREGINPFTGEAEVRRQAGEQGRARAPGQGHQGRGQVVIQRWPVSRRDANAPCSGRAGPAALELRLPRSG